MTVNTCVFQSFTLEKAASHFDKQKHKTTLELLFPNRCAQVDLQTLRSVMLWTEETEATAE